MSRERILRAVDTCAKGEGLTETGIAGVRLFRATAPIPCAPAVYGPCIVAIISGAKEVVLDGRRYDYDHRAYLCCPTALPVMAGTPGASPARPLLGVMVTLDHRLMTELAMEMERAGGAPPPQGDAAQQGIRLAEWDEDFTDALERLLRLVAAPADAAVLGEARVRELYYAILKGEAGGFARRAFGPANAIARSIAHIAEHLGEPLSIDKMAARAGMSRAGFHRNFKKATTMAPIQFVKSMRVNAAAMKIAGGEGVAQAALDVGYVSPSQFSRDFKRLYGQSPRRWSETMQPLELAPDPQCPPASRPVTTP